jgi:hypothetical protein
MTTTQTTSPATTKQTAFIRTLLAERTGDSAAEAIRDALNAARSDGPISKALASSAIECLLKIKVAKPASPQAPQVADGSYALNTDDVDHPVRFFEVKAGRKPGVVFVDEYASDNRYPVRDAQRRTMILTAIAADPFEAGKRYADEFGHCARCHRGLTDQDSRDRGYGPDCWAKLH